MQPKLNWLAVSFSNYWSFDSNATRSHKIFIKFLMFSYYWLFLISYHIKLKLIAPNGLEKRSLDHR